MISWANYFNIKNFLLLLICITIKIVTLTNVENSYY